jgi:sucrose-phosphate synthase
MRILHLAFGGCLKAPPVEYGVTEDTGGHIAYVLGAAMAQARREDVSSVDIVTRAFDDPDLDAVHSRPEEPVAGKCRILRLSTRNRAYLSKEALTAEIPALEQAFCEMIAALPYRPDVIHAHFADAARAARCASDRFGIPWVYTPHSLALEKGADAETGRVADETRAIGSAHAIIVSSQDEADRQVARYDTGAAGRTHRVPPGVTMGASPGPGPALRLISPFLSAPHKPIILAIARPVRKKNLDTLLRAYAQSSDLQARANLVILAGQRRAIGDGPSEQVAVHRALFDLVDRHDLWGRVALPRRHGSEEVRSLYDLAAQSGGVFANPAHHEPFGLTIVEAARAGLPVAATRSGGPVSILADLGYGLLMDPNDPGPIARAILALLDDPAREVGRDAARVAAERLYRWDGWAADAQAIYRQIAMRIPDARPTPARSRLLACDIDGTLTGDRDAARRFGRWAQRGTGIGLLFATGRSITEARRVIADWGLPCPETLITSVGSEIWRLGGPGAYTLCADFAARVSAGWDRDAVGMALEPLQPVPQARQEQRQWKLSFFGDAGTARDFRARLSESGVQARVVFSHGELIDVLPPRAGKAAALRFEAERHGLSLADCIAAGDSGNDIDMLRLSGRAILPANARDGIVERLAGRAYFSRYRHAAGVLDGLAALDRAAAGAGRTHA